MITTSILPYRNRQQSQFLYRIVIVYNYQSPEHRSLITIDQRSTNDRTVWHRRVRCEQGLDVPVFYCPIYRRQTPRGCRVDIAGTRGPTRSAKPSETSARRTCYSFSTFLFYFFFPPSTNVPIESVSRSGCSFFLANTSSPVPRVPHRARRPYFRRLYSSVPGIISCPLSAVRVGSSVVQSALTTTSYLFLFRFLSSVPGTRPSPAYRPTRPFRRRGVAISVRLPLSEHPNRSRTVCVVPRVVTKGVFENRFSDRYRKNIRIDSKTISEQRWLLSFPFYAHSGNRYI